MKNFYFTVLMLVGLGIGQQQAFAQIVAWNFYSPNAAGSETSILPAVVERGLSVTGLQRGSAGLSGSALSRTFSAIPATINTDRTTTINNNMYVGFNVTVLSGYSSSLSSINYRMRKTATGAKLWFWKYSLNGTDFFDAGTDVITTAVATDTEGAAQPAVDLSGISALQNLAAGTTVYFRLYIGNSGSLAGGTAVGRSTTDSDLPIAIGGSVTRLTMPLIGWQFATPVVVGDETSVDADQLDSKLNTSTLSRGAGFAPISLGRGFSSVANIATPGNTAADTTIAITNNTYYTFTVSPKANTIASLNRLSYKIRRTGGGGAVHYWKWSVNGVGFNKVAEPTIANVSTTVFPEGSGVASLDLSGIAKLQNIPAGTTVTFRLYITGSNLNSGTNAIGRSLLGTTDDYVLAIDGTTASTLPVSLTSFTGKNTGNTNTLSWQTASEKNNMQFDILRLVDGKTSLLGSVNGSGTTSSAKKYTFIDKNPLLGTNYYQLRQVDHDGTAETFPTIVAIKVGLSKNNFTASFSGSNLNVSLTTDKAEKVKITLTDMLGKVVATSNETAQEGQNSFTIPSNVKEGIYIVSIVNGNQERASKKIIK